MRYLLAVPVLFTIIACGPTRLSRSEAEKDIRQDYPLVVPIRIPRSATPEQGTVEHTRTDQAGRTYEANRLVLGTTLRTGKSRAL